MRDRTREQQESLVKESADDFVDAVGMMNLLGDTDTTSSARTMAAAMWIRFVWIDEEGMENEAKETTLRIVVQSGNELYEMVMLQQLNKVVVQEVQRFATHRRRGGREGGQRWSFSIGAL